MRETKSSVLKEIMNDVYQSTDFDEALQIVKDSIEESSIRGTEGRVIVIKAVQCGPSLVNLQQYITNSYFKYEGLGV